MDTLKQTGKRLRKTQKQTDYSLHRLKKSFPTIERDREVITSDDEFYMEFANYLPDDNIRLSIEILEDFV